MIGRAPSSFGASIHRKRLLRSIAAIAALVLAVAGTAAGLSAWIDRGGGGNKALALKAWDEGSYAEVHRIASESLVKTPLERFWLTLHGLSAYQLAAAQISATERAEYIDDAVESLRKALIDKPGSSEARLRYVLGKAYYHKGPEYADLAVSELEAAKAASYQAADLHEYLGLSYAALKDYRSSVVAFTQALGDDPSDLLLLAIAQSYQELGEEEQARAYLIRCVDKSKDALVVAQARLSLAKAYIAMGDFASAENEINETLKADDANADAHYYLGEVYAANGDSVRSRAEWRKALRITPTHGPARARLSM